MSSEDVSPQGTGDVPALDLEELRTRIDGLDARLLDLLNERADLVVQVGRYKREHGTPIYAPEREQAVLAKVLDASQGPLPERTLEAIWKEMMSGSFALEQPLRIGYLGPKGSFSHQAATKHFGRSVSFEDMHEIAGVFTEVQAGRCQYGIVPIENSIGGGVVETLDAFRDPMHRNVRIYAEVQLAVHHNLLANCQPGEIRRVHSKPEAFSQCRQFLSVQYPTAERIPAPSTARAVQTAKAEELLEPGRGSAAIGSAMAGEEYGVNTLFEAIEDDPNNVTRFFVIATQEAGPCGEDKTSVMFNTDDRPGTLVRVLSVFDQAGINLTHIDKRPMKATSWNYTFFLDAVGHRDQEPMTSALAEAGQHCADLMVLGSYPRSRRVL
ncbi:MAG: prephenate dehydratase [Planctomycetota bacterium]